MKCKDCSATCRCGRVQVGQHIDHLHPQGFPYQGGNKEEDPAWHQLQGKYKFNFFFQVLCFLLCFKWLLLPLSELCFCHLGDAESESESETGITRILRLPIELRIYCTFYQATPTAGSNRIMHLLFWSSQYCTCTLYIHISPMELSHV